MLQSLKSLIKNILPEDTLRELRPIGHGAASLVASIRYGRPSNKLVIIGVTGTAGKSTTINLLAHLLNSTGFKTGFITTANYSYGGESFINEHGLSMPNEFLLQKQLKLMVKRGCNYAILECTSEGLAQNRHLGIAFDVALFTNLSPAHIEAHGSFENYRAAKGRLFAALNHKKKKHFFNKKIIGLNLDDGNSKFFSEFAADTKFGISLKTKSDTMATYLGENIQTEPTISFAVNNIIFTINLFGSFNVYNALLAVAAASELGLPLTKLTEVVRTFPGMPGRMENIPNNRDITIFVDYAPEPKGMEEALGAVNKLPHKRVIHVFGSTGGHRDTQKRFEFGKITAAKSDIVIICNDDVYDSNPLEIAEDIKEGINQIVTERKAKTVEIILDRRQAIKKALEMAEADDIVIFTGKGSEQFLVLPGNKRIEWDERKVVKEVLDEMSNS